MSRENEIIKKTTLYLQKENIYFNKDYYLKYNTYFKTGGTVKLFVVPQSEIELQQLIKFLHLNKISYKIIGYTSNVIFFDEITYSIIISTENLKKMHVKENMIEVEAGYSMQDFVRVAAINNFGGLEGLEGIPGSIGGGIVMNAGAYGCRISDNIISVDCINPDGTKLNLSKEECCFDYRDSIFKRKNYIIVKAKFKLRKKGKNKIFSQIETYHIARHSYQEFAYPNLGSMLSADRNIYEYIFKKNVKYYSKYWLLKLLLKNPVTKFLKRKRPDNIAFNKLLFKYFKDDLKININYEPSKKGINTLINDGQHHIKDILDYLFLIYRLCDEKFPIENELIVEPVHSMDPNFLDVYNKILNVGKKT